MNHDARVTLYGALAIGLAVTAVGVGCGCTAVIATGPALTGAGLASAFGIDAVARQQAGDL